MTIKTLEDIYYRLRGDADTKRKEYVFAREEAIEMSKDENTTDYALKMQKALVEDLQRAWAIAQDALESFEECEWRVIK